MPTVFVNGGTVALDPFQDLVALDFPNVELELVYYTFFFRTDAFAHTLLRLYFRGDVTAELASATGAKITNGRSIAKNDLRFTGPPITIIGNGSCGDVDITEGATRLQCRDDGWTPSVPPPTETSVEVESGFGVFELNTPCFQDYSDPRYSREWKFV